MTTPMIANPLSKIGDVIRGSLIADRPEQIPHLFKSVAERVTAQGGKFYIKNFWDDPKPLSLGYVGVHIKIRMPIPPEKTNAAIGTPSKRRYILLELQLHVKAIMDGTEDCAKEIAHRLYKAPREAGEEAISPEIISSSQLVYLTSMTRLLSSKEDLERVEKTLSLVQAVTKAHKKIRLFLGTAMLLHNKKLDGEWNERLQVVVPKDADAVAVVWMETASKISKMLHLPVVKMNEKDDWTNTATSVPELYADATEIAPFFRNMCSQAANSQPGCSFNFGPENGCMIKKKESLLDKMQADQEEELGRFILKLLQKIGRSWSQVTESDSMPFRNFSQLQNLNFSGCSQITDSDLRFIRSLSELQTLSLSGCNQVTNEGLANLECLARLRSLNLSGCKLITDTSLGHFWRLTGLQSYNFDGCKITYAGRIRWLQSLNLSRQSPGPVPRKPESSLPPAVSGSPQSAKGAYLALLIQLLENASVKSDASLVEILESQVEELMEQEAIDLTPKQTKSYQWVQQLLVDQKVSQFIAKKLREMHPQEERKGPQVVLHAQAFRPQTLPALPIVVQQAAPPTLPSMALGAKGLQSSSLHEGKRPSVAEKPKVSLPTQGSVNQGWITPEEQLKRLGLDSLEKDLAAAVTHWYTALTRLAKVCPSVLPTTIPPLPADILQTLDSRCPICVSEKKPDGTPYKIKDTHLLGLIPEEFGSLNYLATILTPYEKANYGKETPLRLNWDVQRERYGNVLFKRTHWVLMSKDILSSSRGKEWNQQFVLVDDLRKKAKVDYEPPTLQQSFSMFVTYKIATGESLYPIANEDHANYYNRNYDTHTRVKEDSSTSDGHLSLGASDPSSGVRVSCANADNFIGVMAIRKLESQVAEPPVSLQMEGSAGQGWITPEEQLKRLGLNSLEKDLAAAVTHWYTALTRLAKVSPRALPKTIPPLPADILRILDSICPIYADQRKPDGTPYKIKDTHILALIPEEFGSLRQLTETILKPYEKATYPEETPLRISSWLARTKDSHIENSFARSHWVLMSKDVLPGSRRKDWEEQEALIVALRMKAKVAYAPPTLLQSYAVFVTYKVATDESLWYTRIKRHVGGHTDFGDHTYTRVKEMANVYHLVFGHCTSEGVDIPDVDNYLSGEIGVVAVREL